MLSTKLAIELLVLTATRSGEVRLAEWSEVDLETRIWKIPPNRMKMRENTSFHCQTRDCSFKTSTDIEHRWFDLSWHEERSANE